MADDKQVQHRIQRIGGLVHEIEEFADPASRAKAKELMQSVMDLHGNGLERVMEIIFQAGDPGIRIIDELGRDPLVGSLLVLYGMHPETLESRVTRAVEALAVELHKKSCSVELLRINAGEVRMRVSTGPHTCGSTTSQLRSQVEEAIYGAAPDVASLIVEGLDGQPANGFVSLDKLLASPAAPGLVATGTDGAD